jgi:hypothetical protein
MNTGIPVTVGSEVLTVTLEALGIPEECRRDVMSLHLASGVWTVEIGRRDAAGNLVLARVNGELTVLVETW